MSGGRFFNTLGYGQGNPNPQPNNNVNNVTDEVSLVSGDSGLTSGLISGSISGLISSIFSRCLTFRFLTFFKHFLLYKYKYTYYIIA